MVIHNHNLLLNNGVEGEVNLILEDDIIDQATSKGGNGEEFILSWDDGENQQDKEARNNTPLNTPTWQEESEEQEKRSKEQEERSKE